MITDNRYAIVMTSTDGLRECFTAAFNGLEMYSPGKIDVHLLASGIDEEWLKKLPSNYTCIPWKDIKDPDQPKRKGSGWEVRFYRYKYVLEIQDDYDAVMILDADSFIVDDLVPLFEKAVAEQVMIAPKNLRGIDINKVTLGNVQGASSPSFHCTPFVFPPKLHPWLIPELYKWGYEEDNGDMATLFRTLLRHDKHKEVVLTPNEQYVSTNWFFESVRVEMVNGLKELYNKDLRMSIVHGRWAMDRYVEHYLKEPKNQEVGNWYDIGKQNSDTFVDTIHWLNNTGPINWKVNESEESGKA